MYEEDTEAAPPQASPAPPVQDPSLLNVGALQGLFPKPEQIEIPKSPVNPGAKWRASAAGALKGVNFGENLSNALTAYNEQENKDAELYQRYLPLAMGAKEKQHAANLAAMQKQQSMLMGWNTSITQGTSALLASPGPIAPETVSQVVSGMVRSGQVPQQVAQGYLSSLPKTSDLRAHLHRAALAASDPFRAVKAPTIKGVKKDETLVAVNPEGTGAVPLVEGKTEPSDALIKFMTEAKIDPNSAEGKQLIKQYGNKISTHAPAANQNVTIKEETEESKTVGKFHGEQYAGLQKGAQEAQARLSNLGRMKQLLVGYNTGRATPIMKDIASFGTSFGIQIDPNQGPKEAVDALTNQMAMQARNPAGGAGMPGAMSDTDRVFLKDTVPGLAKSKNGNVLIIETMRRLSQRDIEVAQLAAQYRQKNGHIDNGFQAVLQDYAEKHPLFADKLGGGGGQPRPPAARAAPASNVDELVRRAQQGGK